MGLNPSDFIEIKISFTRRKMAKIAAEGLTAYRLKSPKIILFFFSFYFDFL
jgi:hypothetical protein